MCYNPLRKWRTIGKRGYDMGKTGQTDHNAAALRPVRTQKASEAIYEQIKGLILSGELRPGDRLPSERSMMESMQRSRPTIREALRMLEHAGLIRTLHGAGGAVVCAPGTVEAEESLMLMLRTSAVSVAELSEYRLCTETAMVRWAALRRGAEDLDHLDRILEDAEAQLAAEEFDAFVRHDAAFHCALALAGGNKVASMMARILSDLSMPKTLEALSRQSGEEKQRMCRGILSMHREILEAVRAGDAAAAEKAMERHIRAFGAELGMS